MTALLAATPPDKHTPHFFYAQQKLTGCCENRTHGARVALWAGKISNTRHTRAEIRRIKRTAVGILLIEASWISPVVLRRVRSAKVIQATRDHFPHSCPVDVRHAVANERLPMRKLTGYGAGSFLNFTLCEVLKTNFFSLVYCLYNLISITRMIGDY